MATNPSALPENSGRITAPDANYPYGSAQDDSTGTTGDGTPIKKAILNDTYGFYQWLLTQAGIVPSGNAETALSSQLGDALNTLFLEIANKASQAEAENGVDDVKWMTPLRTNQSFGQFGLGQDLTLVGSLDLDSISDTSIRYGSGLVNAPAGVSTGIVSTMYITAGGGRSFQLLFPVLSGDMYIRSNNGGTWGSWNEIHHDGNTPKLTSRGNFDGTGTPSIRDGINFASITDNGTGDYTVNFTTPLSDANYSAVASSDAKETATLNYTINGFDIQTSNSDGTQLDRPEISFIVTGGN